MALANHFLTAKLRRLEAGDMGQRSYADYHATCARMIKLLGKHRLADDVEAGDFGVLRAQLATTRGPVSLGNEIGRIRSVFKFAYDSSLLDKPVRFGPEFAKPPKRAMRQAKHARGERMFEPKEIKRLLETAGPQMRAMILLGLNCGLGNTDVAMLPRSALDLKKRILDFPRPKTGVRRRSILWPETLAALKVVEEHRPGRPSAPRTTAWCSSPSTGGRGSRSSRPKAGRRWTAVVKDAVVLEFGKELMRGHQDPRARAGFLRPTAYVPDCGRRGRRPARCGPGHGSRKRTGHREPLRGEDWGWAAEEGERARKDMDIDQRESVPSPAAMNVIQPPLLQSGPCSIHTPYPELATR